MAMGEIIRFGNMKGSSPQNAVALRLDFLDAFDRLVEGLERFRAALLADPRPAMAIDADNTRLCGPVARKLAARILTTITFRDDQDPRGTLRAPGLIGAGPELLEAAVSLNEQKLRFHETRKALERADKGSAETTVLGLPSRSPLLRETLKRARRTRLHLRQADRKVLVLPERTWRVSFSWSSNSRSIERLSVAEARALLERLGARPGVQEAFEALDRLSPDTPLARAYPKAPHLRANVYFFDESGAVQRKMVVAPTPLLVPLEHGKPLPEDNNPSAHPSDEDLGRLSRIDTALEPEPFLPLIHVYRYRNDLAPGPK